jgi:hypothetical protein
MTIPIFIVGFICGAAIGMAIYIRFMQGNDE